MAAHFRVKAVYEYSSPHEDDLNFDIGQIITVTDQDDDDWYGGEYLDASGAKKEGIFPRNFVEKIEPTAPPRPTRTRQKKEADEPPAVQQVVEPSSPVASVTSPQHERPPVPEPEEVTEEAAPPAQAAAVASPPAPAAPKPAPVEEPVPVPKAIEPPAAVPADNVDSAPAPVKASKPKPAPPVAGKPTSNAFKDRIAAFNKPAAAPITPFKPGGAPSGSSGFIKKPFVAPPPSRNAYVPPPQNAPSSKVYRRDEDPEIKEKEAENQGQAERAGLVPAEGGDDADEDQPKPTSLKERIALLQQQQKEQAQRHADSAVKKDKPKKPLKKPEPTTAPAPAEDEAEVEEPATPQRRSTEDTRTSTDDGHSARFPPPPRRKSSKGPSVDTIHDGNEADMSGAGDTTEGQDDTTEREDSEEPLRRGSRPVPVPPPSAGGAGQRHDEPAHQQEEDNNEEDEEEEEEEEVDPEVRRKEELRARMAKMSGGMGFHGMFGGGMPVPGAAPPKKKKSSKPEVAPAGEEAEEAPQSPRAPPVPTMMALPGMGQGRKSLDKTEEEEPHSAGRPPPLPPVAARPSFEQEDDEDDETTPGLTPATTATRESAAPPPIPAGRPAPPPVPSESRPPPPPPPANLQSASEGSASDDELSGAAKDAAADSASPTASRPPPIPPFAPQSPELPSRSPPLSPRPDLTSPTSPIVPARRNSRPPPPIPGAAPPVPGQNRPPPPPPGAPAEPAPTRPPQAGEENEDEGTEYEGDYDTDIASSVPHKDALKSHARESSLEDNTLQSPTRDAPPNLPPPIPSSAAPRAVPPPIPSQPSQPAPEPALPVRRSIDAPRAAPPPPPPGRDSVPPTPSQDDYDPYSYASPTSGYVHKTPKIEEEAYFPNQPAVQSPSIQSPQERRAPPAAPGGRGRQSLDVQRPSMSVRRSVDQARPPVDSDFIANDIDLTVQSGWWKQANQVPPVLQGRKDIYFESSESTTTNQGSKTVITREIYVLFQDYSQSILTARYDPYDPADVELEQRHDPPPRALRQDQMEEFYERFGRPISDAVSSKKDSVVGDGTPQGLVLELLRPFRDALRPVGSRAYGALVYSNMANASTQQNDVIRPGDILSIRNAKFQGKHGPMHAKYSAEVGKPDHVAIVSEWDGTKKKVRAWEQGRESKKVKVESFKLDDLRSGEVKIWRVMPRSWVGWSSQP